MKIISGGQTGVDRAALDAALKYGIECGGWCPAGRLDELGRIPDRYPVKELELSDKERRSPGRPGGLPASAPEPLRRGSETAAPWPKRDVFAGRTLENVRDSDGTVVIYFGELRGGTAYTAQCCAELKRPHRLIDAAEVSTQDAAKLIVDFVQNHKIDILNVAGPRESEWANGYAYAFRALDIFLSGQQRHSPARS